MNELNKDKILNTLKKQFSFLNEKYHIRKIGLFGSYANEMQNENSDIDLIVEFDKPVGLKFIELGDYLEKLFNRKIDLLTSEGLINSKLILKTEQIIYVN